MTTVKPLAILTLAFGLGINAAATHPAFAADGSSSKNSVRQATATEAADSTDDLVLPDLDRPANSNRPKSANQNANHDNTAPQGDKQHAQPRSGSTAKASSDQQAKRTGNPNSSNARAVTENDSDQPSTAEPKRAGRPIAKTANPPADDYPSAARNSQRSDVTQSSANMPQSSSYNGSKYPPNYRSGYTQMPNSRPASAMYFDGNVQQNQRPSYRMAQNSPGVYSDGRPVQRMANRYQPTPASPDGPPIPPPDNGAQPMQESIPPGNAPGMHAEGAHTDGVYGDDMGMIDGNCPSCGDDCCQNSCSRGGWFAGAELMVLRPTSSENVAFQREVSTTDDVASQVDTVVQRDWGYKGSFRTFVGYRFCDCCEEIRFTYWNYNASTRQLSGVVPEDGSTAFTGQLEVNALNPGDRLQTNNSLLMNTYDIDYSKCICYDDQCSCCAPWGLKYFVGIRIADVRRGDNTQINDSEDSVAAQSFISTHFVGAGPRVGLEGRRNFGCNNCWSIYARSNLALMLGEFDIDEHSVNSQSSTGTFVNQTYLDSHDRMIPEAEIELGLNWQYSCHTTISAGYTWQAWWDLGMFEQGANTFQEPIDTASILSLDGFFLRMEYCF